MGTVIGVRPMRYRLGGAPQQGVEAAHASARMVGRAWLQRLVSTISRDMCPRCRELRHFRPSQITHQSAVATAMIVSIVSGADSTLWWSVSLTSTRSTA